MTFDELRITYQCPERLARHLYDQLSAMRAELAQVEAVLAIAEAQRNKLKNKQQPAPRRAQRDREST